MLPVQGKPSYDDKVLGREKEFAKGGPDPEKEDEVMLVRERVSRIYYNRQFFDGGQTYNKKGAERFQEYITTAISLTILYQ